MASLEYQLKYRVTIKNEEIFTNELKRCVEEIGLIDIALQIIRGLIENEN
ncbi:hypothetical protein NSA50_09550 [Clostridium sp. DSM 100503]|nr:hypothetical protein [Clostridium sp. DSM 100503]MCR1951293.1 hypothetical protein [Clostridium sp. DSM 100503]